MRRINFVYDNFSDCFCDIEESSEGLYVDFEDANDEVVERI